MTDEQLVTELKRLDGLGKEGVPGMRDLLRTEGGMSRVIGLAERGLARVIRQKAEVRKTLIPADSPTDTDRAAAVAYWQKKRRPDLVDRVAEIAEQYHDHHFKEGSRYPRENWGLVWKTWYTNALRFERPPTGGSLFAVKSGQVVFEQTNTAGWVTRLEVWHQSGGWSPEKWGLPPNETGNRVPVDAWDAYRAKHPPTRARKAQGSEIT